MRRFSEISRRWKRIWRGDGVVGSCYEVDDGMQPGTHDNGIYRVLTYKFTGPVMISCDNSRYQIYINQ